MFSGNHEIRCPQCSFVERATRDGMLARLRAAGFLRRQAHPTSEEIAALAATGLAQAACPACGAQGLRLAALSAAVQDWAAARRCRDCREMIPEERLEIFPDAERCAACEARAEAAPASEVEYCPRCGAPLAMRAARGGGLARYELACTSPGCRGR